MMEMNIIAYMRRGSIGIENIFRIEDSTYAKQFSDSLNKFSLT